MEQHAVPQDITGFTFKLVGDMTLKQFGELGAGAVVAFLVYSSSLHFVVKWPLVFFFAVLGFALAFFPLEERPLDVWIINFFKAIYKPTLYVWKKGIVPRPALLEPSNVTTFIGQTTTPQPWPFPTETPKVEEKPVEKKPEVKTNDQIETKPVLSIEEMLKLRDQKNQEAFEAIHPPRPAPPPPKEPDFLTVDALAARRDEKKMADRTTLAQLSEQSQALENQIKATQTKMLALTGSDTSDLQTQLQDLERRKADLVKQMTDLQDQIEGTGAPQTVVVEKPVGKATTIQLTDVPNIINGIITNDKGAPLDNVILVVKDKTGNSIRALKTNQVGQFIASTPLENNVYYLEFERAGFTFQTLEISLTGSVITPIQVIAKNADGHS